MAQLVFANLVAETATAAGTGAFALQGAVSTQYSSFSGKIQIGSSVVYTARQGALYEVGYGVLTSSTQLTRVGVFDSSAASGYVNSVTPGSPGFVTFDSTQTLTVYNDVPAQLFLALNTDGSLAAPTPLRKAIIIDTNTQMKALATYADGESVFVTGFGDTSGVTPGLFRFNAGVSTAPDGVDTFRNNNSSTGLYQRQKLVIQAAFENTALIDSNQTVGSGTTSLTMQANPAATNPNDYFGWVVDTANSAWRRVSRLNQTAAKTFMNVFSLGNAQDRIETTVPFVQASVSDSTGLKARSLAWLSGVSRLVLARVDASTATSAADYREIPLTKGGYIVASVKDIYDLKQIDPTSSGSGFADYDMAQTRGINTASSDSGHTLTGSSAPAYWYWLSTSTLTEDLVNVVRPSVGSAASGNGRWIREVSDITAGGTFTSGVATPSVKNGGYFITAGSTAITNFLNGYEGQRVIIQRGSADITITHNGTNIDLGGTNVTLTATNPRLELIYQSGIWRSIGIGTVNLATNVTGALPIANGGTGANTAAAALTALGVLNQIYEVSVADYFSGTLTYVNPGSAVNYATRQTAPDITTALAAAISAAQSRASAANKISVVTIPAGLYTLSATITIPSGVFIRGQGQGTTGTATHLRRIGDYGNTFNIGTPGADQYCFDVGISNMLIYQDHGGTNNYGYQGPATAYYVGDGSTVNFAAPQTPVNQAALAVYVNGTLQSSGYSWSSGTTVTFSSAPASGAKIYIMIGPWLNQATTGCHILATGPRSCYVDNLSLWGMPTCLKVLGGTGSVFSNIDTNGWWDPDFTIRQEGVSGVELGANINTSGINIPTWHTFENVRPGGATKNATVTYTLGSNSFATVMNIGPKYGFKITCLEECYFRGLNVSASQKSSVLFSSLSSQIIQGANFTGCVFSPCGTDVADAYVKFENQDAGGQVVGVSFSGCQWLGQGNGFRAISDYGSTATYGSVTGLSVIGGEMNTFVGGLIYLINARHVDIHASLKDFNTKNYYTGDNAAAVYVSSGCKSVCVGGVIGGAATGSTSGSSCIDGVRAQDAVNSRVVVSAANGGLSGSLFLNNGSPVPQSSPIDGTGFLGDTDATLTWGNSPPTQLAGSTLTTTRTITLATTDNFGSAIPNGATFIIFRTGGGSTLNVSGFPAVPTGQTATFTWYGGAWRQAGAGYVSSTYLPSTSPVVNLVSVTTGQTVTIASTTTVQLIGAAGSLAALTVVLPSTPTDGQEISININIAVTTLTITGATAATKPTSATAGMVLRYIYNAATSQWWQF